jgi:ABC-type transport system involved in cytochrome bd biosynthesis fused ATPase/permease subunit
MKCILDLKIRCFFHIYNLESFISVVSNTNATYVGFIYLASLYFERTVVCCLLAADFYWNCNLRHVSFLP